MRTHAHEQRTHMHTLPSRVFPSHVTDTDTSFPLPRGWTQARHSHTHRMQGRASSCHWAASTHSPKHSGTYNTHTFSPQHAHTHTQAHVRAHTDIHTPEVWVCLEVRDQRGLVNAGPACRVDQHCSGFHHTEALCVDEVVCVGV